PGDQGAPNAIALDLSGDAYIVGSVPTTFGGSDFPATAGAFQTSPGSAGTSGFVAELNPTGSALVYGTYLHGNTEDKALGVAVDLAGNAYVTGWTRSTAFPISSDAFQTSLAGGQDAFVTELNASGSAPVY